MKRKKTEVFVQSHEAEPVRIVADAAISTRGRQGGRMLPFLLLDTSQRPDIKELIRVHQSLGPGDVEAQWGHLTGHDDSTVALFLTFIRPIELFMVLEFQIAKQGIIVEQALRGQALYIDEAEGADDRVMKNPNRPSIIVGIPDTGFQKTWDGLFHKYVAKDFRDMGLSRSDSRRAARSAIEELRNIGNLTMRDIHD
jgi:hypothetical protein